MFAPAISQGGTFARDDRGVTMVEFGILAVPFFTMIFAILETALMLFANQVLDSAVEDASRMVRTGEAQNASFTVSDFRNLLCSRTFGLFGDCSAVVIRVRVIPDFASATLNSSVQNCDTNTCTWNVADLFTPGGRRQIIQVSAYYRWPLIATLPYFNLKNQPDNFRLFSATRVFRNEPF